MRKKFENPLISICYNLKCASWANFEDLFFQNIKIFNEVKTIKKLKKPKLHIVYLMLKENISEVPSLIDLAKDIGIKEIILTNLIHVTNEWQERQKVFKCEDSNLNEAYEELLMKAEIKAKKLKIKLKRPSLSPVDVALCEENPLRNLYISVDGEVSPCVYLYPPTSSPFKRIFCGKEYEIEKLSFGNIFREPFQKIYNSKKYTGFRDAFIQRKRWLEEMSSYLLNIERLKRFEITPPPQPPEHCRTCHKILGF